MEIKRVWFVSHYSMPPEYEMRIKTQMYAHYLGEWGIDCTIFSASTIHNTDINLIEGNDKCIVRQYGDLKFVHIKCDQYSGNGISRLKNMLQFSAGFIKVAEEYPLPDVVVADVNCVNYEKIYNFCKKYGIPMYIDMRDLWPDSIIEYLHFSKNNPIIRYLYHREKKMYERADGVIFSMEGGRQYILDKKWDIDIDKIYYINNGVNIEQFDSDILNHTVDDPDLNNDSIFKIVYAGSIRTANNIQALVEAAKHLKETNAIFLIYGDGDQRIPLEEFCKNNEIQNVIFKGKVGKSNIPYILSRCQVSVLNYQKADTWIYGGSQNKLFEYLAVGHPVLCTIKMNYSPIERYNCGISLNEPDSEKIAEAILQLMKLPLREYEQMGRNARRAAESFDYRELSNKLLKILSHEKIEYS